MSFLRRTHAECLGELTGWVMEGRPFCSIRLTDGEMIAMFRTRPPTDVTADGNPMSVEIGDAIRETILGFAEHVKADPAAAIQFGTTCFQHPDAETKLLVAWCQELGVFEKFRWINGHDMLDGVVDGLTRDLFTAIRENERPVFLMGQEAIGPAAKCLGATFIPVPMRAWDHRDKIHEHCQMLLRCDGPESIFVWCTGMGTKPLEWQLWKEFPRSSHMNAGHIFDAAFGIASREWIRNKEAPWWEPYTTVFAPWVRSFIK